MRLLLPAALLALVVSGCGGGGGEAAPAAAACVQAPAGAVDADVVGASGDDGSTAGWVPRSGSRRDPRELASHPPDEGDLVARLAAAEAALHEAEARAGGDAPAHEVSGTTTGHALAGGGGAKPAPAKEEEAPAKEAAEPKAPACPPGCVPAPAQQAAAKGEVSGTTTGHAMTGGGAKPKQPEGKPAEKPAEKPAGAPAPCAPACGDGEVSGTTTGHAMVGGGAKPKGGGAEEEQPKAAPAGCGAEKAGEKKAGEKKAGKKEKTADGGH